MSLPELSRRGALGALLAGLTAVGCDLTSSDLPPADTTPGTSPTTSAAPDPDPDTALVVTVRGELAATLALVTAAVARAPGVSAEVTPFRRLHRRHLDALPGEAGPATPPRLPAGQGKVRAQVRRQELRLQQALAEAAVRSESGPLAALLASMSAAVAQQLATAPGGAP